jgi:hypothetical protein
LLFWPIRQIAGLVPPPESPIEAARLTATNGPREQADLPTLMRLNDAWTGYFTLVTKPIAR